MDLIRRLPKAALVTLAAFLLFGSGVGFVAAAGDPVDGRVPETFQVAEPHEGDHWEYTADLTLEIGGEAETDTGLAASYRWGEATMAYDTDGVPHHVQSLEDLASETVAYVDVDTAAVVAYAFDFQYNETRYASFTPLGVGPGFDTLADVDVTTRVVHYDGGGVVCGFLNDLQGQELDLSGPVRMKGGCLLDGEGGLLLEDDGATAFRAFGSKTVAGMPTVGLKASSDAGSMTLWLNRDIPYPVALDVDLRETISLPAFDGTDPVEQELHLSGRMLMTAFVPGTVPLAPADGPLPVPLTPVEPRPATRLSVDDSGIEHPFRLSEAYDGAMADPTYSDLRDFMAAHPDARAVQAGGWTQQDGDYDVYGWTFRMWDDESLVVDAERRIARPGTPAAVVQQVAGPEEKYGDLELLPAPDFDFFPVIDRDRIPDRVPDLSAAAARFTEGTGLTMTDYGFDYSCTIFCWGDVDALYVGHADDTSSDPDLVTGEPGAVHTFRHRYHFDEQGRLLYEERAVEEGTTTTEGLLGTGGSDPVTYADPRPVGSGHPVWAVPSPEAAAGIGFVAVLVGLAYWVWPSIKAGGLVGLFSRVRPDALLENPVRAGIYSAVQETPGIHYQQLLRETGRSSGVVEHHLRKLQEGGYVVSQSNGGHTCFFPKGLVDHAVMAAVPVLRTEGAVRVLQDVLRHEGTTMAELAQRVGIVRSTASHHVRRLREAGLIEPDGPLRVASIARQALSLAA